MRCEIPIAVALLLFATFSASEARGNIANDQPTPHLLRERSIANSAEMTKEKPATQVSSQPMTLVPNATSKLASDPTDGLDLPTTPKVISSVGGSFNLPTSNLDTVSKEQPHYWSALENYYSKLRRLPYGARIQPVDSSQMPIYVIDQRQQDVPEDLLFAHQKTSRIPPHKFTTKEGRGNPAFLLPTYSGQKDQEFYGSQQRQIFPQQSQQPVSNQGITDEKYRTKLFPGVVEENHIKVDLPIQQASRIPEHICQGTSLQGIDLGNMTQITFIGQLQRRISNQRDVLGPAFNPQLNVELSVEESYCGPCNLLDGSQSLAYPSHVGIYNGEPINDNYLCAGSWIHDKFVLTLASCVSKVEARRIFVRLGEWNSGNTRAMKSTLMFVDQAEKVFLFPDYRNDSFKHNLALIKITKSMSILDRPFICPACQMPSRTFITARRCTAPARNITTSEYFDGDGEGETKLQKTVRMEELQINLIAHNDEECFKETGLEYHNMKYPDHICSSDIRKAQWRTRHNQSEYLGSGVYCQEAGRRALVSIIQPVIASDPQASGYLDLHFYKPWLRDIIAGRIF